MLAPILFWITTIAQDLKDFEVSGVRLEHRQRMIRAEKRRPYTKPAEPKTLNSQAPSPPTALLKPLTPKTLDPMLC